MRRHLDSRDTHHIAVRSRGGSRLVASLLVLVAAACGGEAAAPETSAEISAEASKPATGPQAETAELVVPAAPVAEVFAAHEPRAMVDERAVVQSRGFRSENLSFDWGSVAQGEVVVHRFELRNDTQNHVMLVPPRGIAKGVTVDFDRDIEPFSEGRVDVRVDTSALRVGDSMIRVPLLGNVVNAPTLVLRGSVTAPVAAAGERK